MDEIRRLRQQVKLLEAASDKVAMDKLDQVAAGVAWGYQFGYVMGLLAEEPLEEQEALARTLTPALAAKYHEIGWFYLMMLTRQGEAMVEGMPPIPEDVFPEDFWERLRAEEARAEGAQGGG